MIRPGGVSAGLAERERERTERSRAFERAKTQHERVEREVARRQAVAAVQDKKRSKRNLARGDSDGRFKIDAARVAGKDGHAGRLQRQLDGKRDQAAAELSAVDRPVRERVGVTLHGRRLQRDAILVREAGAVELGDGRSVTHPELGVAPGDRIAIRGRNGSGKSTLLSALIQPALTDPTLPDGAILWIPQEISLARSRDVARAVHALDHDEKGNVVSTVARLGSDPERVLSTEVPSPGEVRKLLLALGLERAPALVAMDEPTNHLDLVSIQCVEEALADFAGALLLVSHDERFLRALTDTSWTIRDGELTVREANA